MKTARLFLALCCFLLLASSLIAQFGIFAARASRSAATVLITVTQDADKLVFADFETMKDNRPVSSRGGWIQINSNQESPGSPNSYKGMTGVNPPAPELVRLSRDSPNKAATFDYSLLGANQWASVGIEIHGQPDKDGKPVPDDVSAYKYLSLQAYATGVQALRIELTSRGQGLTSNAFPQFNIKVSPGFNTYRIQLKNFGQPSWADPKLSTKDVLKKLTAVSVTAACGPCVLISGTVVVDNLVFEN
jgi:hypothetical protein